MSTEKRASSSGPVTRVAFSLSNTDYPFVGVTTVDGCRTSLEEFIPRGRGTYAEFLTVSGADPDRVLEMASAHESVEPTVLDTYDSGALFEFQVNDDCPAIFLSERGALPCEITGADGQGRICAEIPESADPAEVVDEFLAEHPEAELVEKRRQPSVTAVLNPRTYRLALKERLTDRQEEVFVAAYEAGYYEWPRETTAQSLAEEFDISTSSLLKHLRSVEQKFVRLFFER